MTYVNTQTCGCLTRHRTHQATARCVAKTVLHRRLVSVSGEGPFAGVAFMYQDGSVRIFLHETKDEALDWLRDRKAEDDHRHRHGMVIEIESFID